METPVAEVDVVVVVAEERSADMPVLFAALVDTDENPTEVESLPPLVVAAAVAADVPPLGGVYAPVFTLPLSPNSPI